MAKKKTNSMFKKPASPKYVQLRKAAKKMAELTKAMEKDGKDLEDLIAQVEEEMNLNPVDVMQAGDVERMTKVQDLMGSQYKTCAQEFRDWIADYATVLDATVKAALVH